MFVYVKDARKLWHKYTKSWLIVMCQGSGNWGKCIRILFHCKWKIITFKRSSFTLDLIWSMQATILITSSTGQNPGIMLYI